MQFTLILTLTFLFSQAFGQQYSLKQYTVADGLPQSQVTSVVEDDNGYLWLGTVGGGVAQFDGKNFKTYNVFDGLQNNIVTGLTIDRKRQLWVCHPYGVSKFERGGFKQLEVNGSEKMLRRIFEFQDTLFFISGNGKLGTIINDKMTEPVPISKKYLRFVRLTEGGNEVLFFLEDNTILVKGKKGTRTVNYKDHFSEIENVFNVKENVMLMTNKGYFQLDIKTLTFSHQSVSTKNSVIFNDQKAQLFWTINNRTLLKESLASDKVKIDTVLSDVEVFQILQDREANTWIATSGSGLYCYSIKDFDKCSSSTLKTVMAITKDRQGATWIGTANQGLKRMSKGKLDTYTIGDSNYGRAIRQVKESVIGDIWVASFGGLAKFDPRTNTFKVFDETSGLPSKWISCFDFDANGGLWVASKHGITYFKDNTAIANYKAVDNLPFRNIHSIFYFTRNKTVYAGTDLGLSALQGGKIRKLEIRELTNSTVLTIHPFRDSLLLIGSSGSGALIYNPASRKSISINSRNGLPSDLVYFIASDQEDYVWVGTERGINKMKLNDRGEIIENFNYCRDNGLIGMETNHDAFYLGKEKYFGLVDGIYQYNDLPRLESSFSVHLTQLDLFDDRKLAQMYSDSATGFFQLPVHIRLPPDKNHITFHFNKVDKRYPSSIRFKHYLENFDNAWSKASNLQQVTYSNLPPGDYTFKVRASDSRGMWNTPPASYSFTIQTPLYQKAWFMVGLIVLLISIIVFGFYWRIRTKAILAIKIEKIKFREQEAIRKELARDFHDEMGNQLTRIINYVSLLKLNGSSNGHVEIYNKVESSAKYLYTGTRDFIWSIDPSNDDVVKIFLHIKDFAENLLKEKGINLRVYNEITDRIFLHFGMSREITLIFKEAFTNIFHHSKATNVTFSLRWKDGKLEISLVDDGVGFSMGDMHKMNGIANMRERAKRMNSLLRIKSDGNSNGSQIVLIINKIKSRKYDIAL